MTKPGSRGRYRLAPWLIAASVAGPAIATGKPQEGERFFQQQCSACHSVTPNQKRTGPNLVGLMGRKAGTAGGVRYSDAMKNSDIIWNGRTLDAFLAAPRKAIPGTTMAVAVTDPKRRAAIVRYLLDHPAE